jgi:acyl carrier protein
MTDQLRRSNSDVEPYEQHAGEQGCTMKLSDSLENELKQLIVTTLRLEDIRPQDIDSDQPLFNEGLGLDSIDGLELGIAIAKTYKIELSHDREENKQYFANVRNLVLFIRQRMTEKEA